jgi:hypothetical protein
MQENAPLALNTFKKLLPQVSMIGWSNTLRIWDLVIMVSQRSDNKPVTLSAG